METLIIIGTVMGMIYLGVKFEGRTAEKNKMASEKMTLLHKLCNKGDGESCYYIGREYWSEGGYYDRDLDEALKYFKKACDLKYATGCRYAAMIYAGEYPHIRFRDYNIDKAIKYYKLSTIKGYEYEYFQEEPEELEEIYMNIKKNIQNGAFILSRACDNGNKNFCGETLGYFEKSARDIALDYYMNKHPEKCKKCSFMDKWSL